MKSLFYAFRVLTPSEKALENAAKKKRDSEEADAVAIAGWRHVNPKTEVFLMDGHAPAEAFASFILRNRENLKYKTYSICLLTRRF